MVASQRHTPSLLSAYKTHTKHGRQSETHTLSPLCLQDPHEAWSPVRDTHSLSSLPTRPTRSMVASQRHTPSLLSAYKTHTKHGRQSETHTPLSSLPTRPARSMVASQRHTPLSPLCLQDPHEAWSPVRDTHPSLLSAYKTHTKHGRQSETHTPLSSLPTRPARSMVASQRHTPLSPLCLQDPHEAWSPVRDTHPSLLSAYKTRTKHGRRYTHLSSLPTRPARSMVAGHLWTHGNSLSFSKWSTSLSHTSGGWLYPGPPSRSLSPGHTLSFPLVVDLRHFSPYLLSLPHSFFSSCSAQSHPHLSRSISLTFLSLSLSISAPTIPFPSHYSVIVTQ